MMGSDTFQNDRFTFPLRRLLGSSIWLTTLKDMNYNAEMFLEISYHETAIVAKVNQIRVAVLDQTGSPAQ